MRPMPVRSARTRGDVPHVVQLSHAVAMSGVMPLSAATQPCCYKARYRGGLYACRSLSRRTPGPMTRGHSPKLSTGRTGALLGPISRVRRSGRPLRSAPGISRWRYVMA